MSGSMWIGVDPGVTGGLAAIVATGDGQSALIEKMRMPVEIVGKKTKVACANRVDIWFNHLFRMTYTIRGIVVEQNSAMPGQGVTSMFSFGRSTGVVEAVAKIYAARSGDCFRHVTPSKWKRDLQFGTGSGKDQSLMRAEQYWPSQRCLWAVKRNDGIAEAALMAKWGLDQAS